MSPTRGHWQIRLGTSANTLSSQDGLKCPSATNSLLPLLEQTVSSSVGVQSRRRLCLAWRYEAVRRVPGYEV